MQIQLTISKKDLESHFEKAVKAWNKDQEDSCGLDSDEYRQHVNTGYKFYFEVDNDEVNITENDLSGYGNIKGTESGWLNWELYPDQWDLTKLADLVMNKLNKAKALFENLQTA